MNSKIIKINSPQRFYGQNSQCLVLKNNQNQLRRSVDSGSKRLQQKYERSSSHNKKFNLDSTCVEGGQDSKQNACHLKGNDTNQFLLERIRKNSHQSKCRSQASIVMNKQKINLRGSSLNQNHLLDHNQITNRLLNTSPCLKHKQWFNQKSSSKIYKPQIKSNLPYDIYPQKYLQNKSLAISKEQKFQKLIEDLRVKHTKRLQQKISKQNLDYKQNCTFIPNIPQSSKHLIKQQSSLDINETIHQRLFHQSKQIHQKLQTFQQQKNLKQHLQIQNNKKHQQDRYKQNKKRWQNILNNQRINNNINSQKPLYQRLENIKDIKRSLLEELRQKYENKNLLYGEQREEKVGFSEENQKSLIKRLVDDYRIKREQQMENIKEQEKMEFENKCTFKPVINIKELFDKSISLGKERKDKEVVESYENYSFSPQINPTTKVIVNKLGQIQNQNHLYRSSNLQFWNRLHDGQSDKKSTKLQNISQQIYKQCTFNPQINQISKQLAYYPKVQQTLIHQCSLPDSIILQQKQLTFKPEINIQSKCMNSRQKQNIIIKKKYKSKEKLEEIENNNQYREIKECTFKPKTISTSEQWNRWKRQYLRKQMVTKVTVEEYGSRKSKIENQNQEQSNIIIQTQKQKHQTHNKIQVKGLKTYLNKCKNAQLKKQNYQQKLQKIFNWQKKYDQRIRKQKENVFCNINTV